MCLPRVRMFRMSSRCRNICYVCDLLIRVCSQVFHISFECSFETLNPRHNFSENSLITPPRMGGGTENGSSASCAVHCVCVCVCYVLVCSECSRNWVESAATEERLRLVDVHTSHHVAHGSEVVDTRDAGAGDLLKRTCAFVCGRVRKPLWIIYIAIAR